MRKKMLSLALALVMCLGLTVPAFAADYTEVVPCKYKEVEDFSEGLASVAIQVGTDTKGNAIVRWGFIDRTGKEVIPCQYRYTSGRFKGDRYEVGPSFSEGLAAVQDENNNWGFIDKTGKVVIPFQYTLAWNFSEGLAGVYLNGKWGYIDKTGQVVIPYTYGEARSFFEGLAMVCVGSAGIKYGFIDKTGKEVIPPQYDRARDFSEGLAAVRDENSKWGFIDKTGKEVIPCQYASAGDFSEGFAWVQDENYERDFIDQTGKAVIPYRYKNAYSFFEGLAMVVEHENGKWGFIDKTGKVVIPFQYNLVGSTLNGFSEGFAVVNLAGKYGYIDKTGREVVPCQYASARPVSEGMAAVAVKGEESGARYFKWGFVCLGDASAPEQPTSGPQVSDWAKEQVSRAAETGLVPNGLGNDYRVNITRAQFAETAVKLYEAMSGQKAPAAGNSPFTDTSDTAVIQAEALGIVNGKGNGKFAPDDLVTRQEAALMLSRVFTKLGGTIPEGAATTFADNDKVAKWAMDAVAFMSGKGIVNGVGGNKFDPTGNASIEQALVIALRMFDNLK